MTLTDTPALRLADVLQAKARIQKASEFPTSLRHAWTVYRYLSHGWDAMSISHPHATIQLGLDPIQVRWTDSDGDTGIVDDITDDPNPIAWRNNREQAEVLDALYRHGEVTVHLNAGHGPRADWVRYEVTR